MMTYTAFISHSTRDARAVEEIRKYLEHSGYACFVSNRDLMHNANWQEQLVSAMDSSSMLIYVHSASSNASAEVCREINYFADRCHRPILVYRIDDEPYNSDRSYYLQSINYIDSLDKASSGLDQLAANVKATLEGRATQTYRQKGKGLRKTLLPILIPVFVVIALAAAGYAMYHKIHVSELSKVEACQAASGALLDKAQACLENEDSLAVGLGYIDRAEATMAECDGLKTVEKVEKPDFQQHRADYLSAVSEIRASKINTVKGLYEPLKFASEEHLSQFTGPILSTIEDIRKIDALLGLEADGEIDFIYTKITAQ